MVRSLLALTLAAAALAGVPSSPALARGLPTCGGQAATMVGTPGDDELTGTDGDDVIVGRGGADVIIGGLGDDRICGGDGDDYLEGHGGTDHLFGGQGDDFADGGVGGCCDHASNTGDDVISGGSGDDSLHSADFSAHGSTLHGRRGADEIFVYSGGVAYGDKGRDTLSQWAGDATLDGGRGGDRLGNGNDPGTDAVSMLGGDGRDELTSDDRSGTTAMDGGPRRDTCDGGTTTVSCER